MIHFSYLSSILSIVWVQVSGEKITCQNTKALDLKHMRGYFEGNRTFWTKAYIGSNEELPYPAPTKLAATEYAFGSNYSTLRTITYYNRAYADELGEIIYGYGSYIYKVEHNFLVDDEKAIFKFSAGNVTVTPIVKKGSIDIDDESEVIEMEPFEIIQPEFKFALIYIHPNRDYYIFQACEESYKIQYSWLQIDSHRLRRRRLSLSIMCEEIKTTIENLNLPGEPLFIKHPHDLYFPPSPRYRLK